MTGANVKRPLGLILLMLVVAIGSFLLGRAFAPRPTPHLPSPVQVRRDMEAATRTVRLYFAAPTADRLQEEERNISRSASFVDEAKQAVAELIKGPQNGLAPTLPSGVELRQLYIDGRGVAYVDFSKDLQAKHPGGSNGELLTIYSIVNTLTANFDQIQRVKILVEGSEVLTLAGHIDTRHPFAPRYSLERAR
jgi:spore germination protein GerM